MKANLARFQALVPDDIKVSATSSISRATCRRALQAVVREALLGALLTGLMVLLFLRDWRSAAIVVITIPFALLAAVVALWGAGPDDQHHDARRPGAGGRHPGRRSDGRDREHPHAPGARHAASRARVLDASGEVVVPRLLAMLSVVAVFVPSFFMTGVSRSLFVPLSLAVGFAMIASFLLSSSLVPVLSVWLLARPPAVRDERRASDWVERLRERLARAAAAARTRARRCWSSPSTRS